MDGEAGTTVADRSTAAVGVANEGGATSDGTTDDQTIGSADDTDGPASPRPRDAATPPAGAAGTPGEAGGADPTGDAAEPADASADDAEPKTARAAGKGAGKAAAKPAGKAARKAAGKAAGKPAAAAADEKAGDEASGDAAEEPSTAEDGPAPDSAEESGTDSSRQEDDDTPAAAPKNAGKGTSPTTGGAGNTAPPNSSTATMRLPAKAKATPPELHSGHKLAHRYQLAECVTRVDGFSSWRAVDEKLRRAVGIHVLPATHPRARQVLAAARSAALLGDPRFVQVLDAVEENDVVYVIHEWLPDATALSELIAAGPLEPHEAYQMVSQVSQAMAAAHREGLAHLRLEPGTVLRTASGQYRIRGLAVDAALRGLSSDKPQRQDTEAIGALLYASLTQRWPHEEDAHGLTGLPKGVGLIAPDQVRAGVHRGLSEIAMRALANDGATASREEPPCTTPEELAKVVAGVPRIRPPENPQPVYQPPRFQQPPKQPGPGPARRPVAPPPPPPPTLPGRTGQALKLAVASLLIVAIGLGSWQLADTLKSRENHSPNPTPTGRQAGGGTTTPAPTKPVPIVGDKDFDPFGEDGGENPADRKKAYDNNPATYWQTSWYTQADLGGLKPGVGLILDLGTAQRVSSVTVDFIGQTSADLLTAPAGTVSMPTEFGAFSKAATGSGTTVKFTLTGKPTTRYLLVWLTHLPPTPDGFRGKISEVHVAG